MQYSEGKCLEITFSSPFQLNGDWSNTAMKHIQACVFERESEEESDIEEEWQNKLQQTAALQSCVCSVAKGGKLFSLQ